MSALAVVGFDPTKDTAHHSARAYPAVSPAEFAVMLRDALRDKSYRASSLGVLVGRFVRWFRNEGGATSETLRDYESVLRRMVLTLADKEPEDVTLEDLRVVLDLWTDREPATRAKVVSVMRSFWRWAEDEGRIPTNPALKLKRPRKPKHTPNLLPVSTDALVVAAAPTARDRLAVLILTDCGVRRAELAGVQVRHLDLARRQVTVTGKGRKQRTIPLRGRIVLAAEEYLLEPLHFVGRQPEPDDYLLYPEWRNPKRVVYRADPKRPKALNGVHRWWYQMLEAAGLVGKNVRSGMNMHRARHTFAQSVRRAYPDMGAVQHLLGHSDPSTTIALYGNYAPEDLERAMEAFARALEEAK